MAVRLEGTIKRFIGSATDEKPTIDVPAGSSFLETDTGIIARYDGRTWSTVVTAHEETSFYQQTIIALLTDIREALYNL